MKGLTRIFLGFLLLPLAIAQAQEPISTDTINQLESVAQLDFSGLAGLSPASGIFVMDRSAERIISFANAEGSAPLSTAVIWDGVKGEIEKTIIIGENAYDRYLDAAGETLFIAQKGRLVALDLASETQTTRLSAPGETFVEVWQTLAGVVCGETAPTIEGEAFILCEDGRAPLPLFEGSVASYARIGRVPAPLAVVSTDEFITSRWNLASNTQSATISLPELAAFGAVNIDGHPDAPGSASHLAWRDPRSENLYLLNFGTGENRRISGLDGSYIAHMQLSARADIIFGIDPMSERGAIWVWLSESGEKQTLGSLRPCDRPQPDLALLSYDSSALVIGCDLGLEIWRIRTDEESENH